MSLLTNDQVALAYQDGYCAKAALFSLKNATALDTVDLAQWFKVVKRVGLVSDTGTTVGSCTFAGTVVTILTGPLNDGVWLLVVGVAA